MTFARAEQFLLSLGAIERREYLQDTNQTGSYLKRLQFLLNILGNPEKKIPHYIHIAGTSGKGSVATYLSSILKVSGKKVGLYISPHPSKLTERWQVNNQPMSESEFVKIVTQLKPALDTYLRKNPYDAISFFELTTAIALYYFAQKKVTWAVMEVGLGGRLDATTIIPHKDVAIITDIGLDHTEILGATKVLIAKEKAGIITSSSPVFTFGDQATNVLHVFEQKIKEKKAPLFFSQLSKAEKKQIIINQTGTDFVYQKNHYHVQAPGLHQARNAVLVINVARHLKISETSIKQGLAKAVQPLRAEIISHSPLIILDGAHNPDKIKSTVNTILELRDKDACIHLIVGFSADKNIRQMIKLLAQLNPTTVACTKNTTNLFRAAASPARIARLINVIMPKTKTEIFLDPSDALAWSKQQTKTSDIVLVTGSIFLSGELRAQFKKL